MRPRIVVPGLSEDIIAVLERAPHVWQTASLISHQLTLPPDAIARNGIRPNGYKKLNGASIVAGRLQAWHRRRDSRVDRRKGPSGRWEYRLASRKTVIGQIREWAATNMNPTPTEIDEQALAIGCTSSTVKQYLWRIRREAIITTT